MKAPGFLTVVALAAAAALPGVSEAAREKPNILLIVSDDQGYPDLGCIGSKPSPRD